jgi:DNA-binding CsgD family transcriptional regulator
LESLKLFLELGDKYGISLCLMDLAGLILAAPASEATKARSHRRGAGATARGEVSGWRGGDPTPTDAAGAVRLLGAAQTVRESIGIELNRMGRKLLDVYIAAASRRLGEHNFARVLSAGRAMSLESAIAWAQSTSPPYGPRESTGSATPSLAPQAPTQPEPGPLTRREREVAALLARGSTNRQIAEALVMSERTVEWHASNILSKLGFHSRAQIAAWAVEHGLAASR